MAECIVLALAGCLVGVGMAFAGLEGLKVLADTLIRMDLGPAVTIPRLDEASVSLAALGFGTCAAITGGVAAGLAAALWSTRATVADELRDTSGPTSSASGHWLWSTRGGLVFTQVAMATVLVVGAGLIVRSYVGLKAVDIGYDPAQILTFQVALPDGRYSGLAVGEFAELLTEELQLVPGVVAAAYAPTLPMVTMLDHRAGFRRTPPPPDGTPDDELIGVSYDYFRVMGMRLLAGRTLAVDDGPGAPRVVVISRSMATRHFGSTNPIGQIAYLQRLTEPWQVVGVVDDVRQMGRASRARPQAFVDSRQWPGMAPGLRFLQYYAVRVEGDESPMTIAPRIRQALRTVDAAAATYNEAPMTALVANAESLPRLLAALAAASGSIAVLVAAIGLYGAISWLVVGRRREIAVRMALGAQPHAVARLVLRQGMVLTLAGVIVGALGAVALVPALQGFLFGVTPFDGPTFFGAACLLLGVATLAALVPLWRALSIDPVVTMKES